MLVFHRKDMFVWIGISMSICVYMYYNVLPCLFSDLLIADQVGRLAHAAATSCKTNL